MIIVVFFLIMLVVVLYQGTKPLVPPKTRVVVHPNTKIAEASMAYIARRSIDLADKEAALDHKEYELSRVKPFELRLPEPDSFGVADLRRPASVPFQPEEPETFDELTGQEHIVKPLRLAVKALGIEERVIHHKLLTGLPGRGKSLIAKVLANELISRAERLGLKPLKFLESYGADLNSVTALDAAVRQLQGGGIWFIDEIHVLNPELATKLYPLMAEGRYPFQKENAPTPIADVMILGATTDYGSLHPALKRRFGEPLMVRPLSIEDLKRMALTLGAIEPDAVEALVARTKFSGAAYELKTLFEESRIVSKARHHDAIRKVDVEEVFATYEIDALGLRWADRQVIKTLFGRQRTRDGVACYAASEQDVCRSAGLDPAEFREVIRPRLLSRDLLTIESGLGLRLTPRAVEQYAGLK
jgi:Holliday junction DNA helicase RuvB